MRNWSVLMSGVQSRFVMDPVPVRTAHLISGRWPETAEGRALEQRAAMTHFAGVLLKDMSLSGQMTPIVARYQVGISLDEKDWPLWPELKIEPPVKDTLARRLLVYEGNHRLACARSLNWEYVLVEPRVWLWSTVKDEIAATTEAYDRLNEVARNLGARRWRYEAASRDDGRPIEPEIRDVPPFHGAVRDQATIDRYDVNLARRT